VVYCEEIVSDHGVNIQVLSHVTEATGISEIKERRSRRDLALKVKISTAL